MHDLEEELTSKGIVDIDAAKLFIFAIQNNLNEEKVKITSADKERLRNDYDPVYSEVTSRIEEYRSIFNLKTDGKGDKNLVIKNVIRFIKNENKTFDELLQIARDYVSQFEHNYSEVKYMRRADYFLQKQVGGTIIKPVLTFLENREQDKTNFTIIR